MCEFTSFFDSLTGTVVYGVTESSTKGKYYTSPTCAHFTAETGYQHGPDVSIEETWSQLSNNIREIQNQNASNLSFEENHRFAYNMVLHKGGELLYKGVVGLVAENLDKLAKEQISPVFPSGGSDIQSQEGEMLLKALRSVWDGHLGDMVKLSQILKYMVCNSPYSFHSTFQTNGISYRTVSTPKVLTFRRYTMQASTYSSSI